MEMFIESPKTDEDIAWSAIFALRRDTAVPYRQITVMVDKCQLVLEGEVDTDQQKTAAETAVSCLPGLKDIRNLITVKKPLISTKRKLH
jgi:osmotically-inducible protein OsmY